MLTTPGWRSGPSPAAAATAQRRLQHFPNFTLRRHAFGVFALISFCRNLVDTLPVFSLPMLNKNTLAGLCFLAVFLGTGLWMRSNFPDAYQHDTGMRLLFRSAHIYILFAALLNLIAGTSPPRDEVGWLALLPKLGAWMLVPAPALFTLAFFIEPAPDSVDRPLAKLGCFWTLGATVLFVAPRWRNTRS